MRSKLSCYLDQQRLLNWESRTFLTDLQIMDAIVGSLVLWEGSLEAARWFFLLFNILIYLIFIKTVDHIDSLCGELYKCYKCLNLDHSANDAMFNYEVDMKENLGQYLKNSLKLTKPSGSRCKVLHKSIFKEIFIKMARKASNVVRVTIKMLAFVM